MPRGTLPLTQPWDPGAQALALLRLRACLSCVLGAWLWAAAGAGAGAGEEKEAEVEAEAGTGSRKGSLHGSASLGGLSQDAAVTNLQLTRALLEEAVGALEAAFKGVRVCACVCVCVCVSGRPLKVCVCACVCVCVSGQPF